MTGVSEKKTRIDCGLTVNILDGRTSDPIDDDTLSDDNPLSVIEAVGEDTSLVSNTDMEMSSDCLRVREGSIEEPIQSKIGCESTQTGSETIFNQATLLDLEMVLEPMHADHQAEKNEQTTSSTVKNLPDTAASSDEANGMGNGNQRKVVEGRDWVMLVARVLKQNGKGMEWHEIVDTWVKLQRYWDDIEVRRAFDFSDNVPDQGEQAYHKGELDAKLRPSFVSRWARTSGDVTSPPHIDDMESYCTSWRVWYLSVLPKSRVGQKGWPPLKRGPTDPLEWDSLRKGSTKGLALLLVSLSGWEGQATKTKHKSLASVALKDLLFVVQQLAAHISDNDTSSLHKRARGARQSRLPPTKRCEYSDN